MKSKIVTIINVTNCIIDELTVDVREWRKSVSEAVVNFDDAVDHRRHHHQLCQKYQTDMQS